MNFELTANLGIVFNMDDSKDGFITYKFIQL